MTSPKHAVSTESGRFYNSLPGFEHLSLGSVTNIVGIKSKPALTGWAAKLAGERAISREDEWHAIQQEEGDEEARKWISAASRDEMDYKAAVGSAVHLACELLDTDVTPGGFTEGLVTRLDGVLAKHGGANAKNIENVWNHVTTYQRFIAEWGVRFVEQERTVFHPDDGWAGTLDAVVDIPDEQGALRRYVMDIKTGSVFADSNALQLAAYRHAAYAVHGNASKPFNHQIHGGFVLQLKPKSYKVHFMRCDDTVYRVFIAARDLWRWAYDESKNASGDGWR